MGGSQDNKEWKAEWLVGAAVSDNDKINNIYTYTNQTPNKQTAIADTGATGHYIKEGDPYEPMERQAISVGQPDGKYCIQTKDANWNYMGYQKKHWKVMCYLH